MSYIPLLSIENPWAYCAEVGVVSFDRDDVHPIISQLSKIMV
jgi:hypothetical protein